MEEVVESETSDGDKRQGTAQSEERSLEDGQLFKEYSAPEISWAGEDTKTDGEFDEFNWFYWHVCFPCV